MSPIFRAISDPFYPDHSGLGVERVATDGALETLLESVSGRGSDVVLAVELWRSWTTFPDTLVRGRTPTGLRAHPDRPRSLSHASALALVAEHAGHVHHRRSTVTKLSRGTVVLPQSLHVTVPNFMNQST